MKNPSDQKTNPDRNNKEVPRQQIADKAYEIWCSEGCPEGRAQAHWQQAEELLTEQPATQSPSRRSIGL